MRMRKDRLHGKNLLVVAAERLAIHVEQKVSSRVGPGCDYDLLRCCWARGGWEAQICNCLTQVILRCTGSAIVQSFQPVEGAYIAAFAIIIRCRRCSGLGVGICRLVVNGRKCMWLVREVTVRAKV